MLKLPPSGVEYDEKKRLVLKTAVRVKERE